MNNEELYDRIRGRLKPRPGKTIVVVVPGREGGSLYKQWQEQQNRPDNNSKVAE